MAKDTKDTKDTIDNIPEKRPDQIAAYLGAIDGMLREEQKMLQTIIEDDPVSSIKRIELAELMLNIASNHIVISGVCLAVINQRSEEALNEARKALYKCITYLEAVVTGYVDAPYSEYEKKIDDIDIVTPEKRYLLMRKMGITIELLKNAYGDNNKWKWTYVELEGRFAVVAKNIINMRDVVANSNLESEHYEPTIHHLALIKKLLLQTADRYREKYELSTGNIDDFRMGINFLSALRRLYFILGDQVESINIKKKFDTWNQKLTSDMIKAEKEAN